MTQIFGVFRIYLYLCIVKKLSFMNKISNNKYLVTSERDALWGLTVSTVGYEDIKPGEDYPTRGHAEGYYFSTSRGRTLNEYQVLYVVEGSGIFQSAHQQETTLKAGDLFLLFPDEWHSYHPQTATGWKCYWIGFRGHNMDDRVKAGFLSPQKPIYHIGYSNVVVSLYDMARDAAFREAAYTQQLLCGIVNHLVGLMYSLERNIELDKGDGRADIISQAQKRIRESLESELSIQQLAELSNMSYSSFRKLFKEFTGLSPMAYQQDLRLQRAKELLSTTNLSIKEIAYRLQFESPDYFSAKFRAKTGLRPTDFRNH